MNNFLEHTMHGLFWFNVGLVVTNLVTDGDGMLIALNIASAALCYLLWRVEVTQRHWDERGND